MVDDWIRLAAPRRYALRAVLLAAGIGPFTGAYAAGRTPTHTTDNAQGIYAFDDEHGVAHLSNVPGDTRYRIFLNPAAANTSAGRVRRLVPARLPASAAIRRWVDDAARTHQVEPALIYAVISVESGFDANALSPKGARGLMQLLPVTAAQYGASDVFDPRQNIFAGTWHLRSLLDAFHGDKTLALAAYNAGATAVTRHGNRIPPYPETAAYVPQVLHRYQMLQGLPEIADR